MQVVSDSTCVSINTRRIYKLLSILSPSNLKASIKPKKKKIKSIQWLLLDAYPKCNNKFGICNPEIQQFYYYMSY